MDRGHGKHRRSRVGLFAILFLWQVPHFSRDRALRRTEFARAGLLVQPNEPDGERQTRRNVVQYTALSSPFP